MTMLADRLGEKKRAFTKPMTSSFVAAPQCSVELSIEVETGKQKTLEELVDFYAELAEEFAHAVLQLEVPKADPRSQTWRLHSSKSFNKCMCSCFKPDKACPAPHLQAFNKALNSCLQCLRVHIEAAI